MFIIFLFFFIFYFLLLFLFSFLSIFPQIFWEPNIALNFVFKMFFCYWFLLFNFIKFHILSTLRFFFLIKKITICQNTNNNNNNILSLLSIDPKILKIKILIRETWKPFYGGKTRGWEFELLNLNTFRDDPLRSQRQYFIV